jgi:hypothetical protein
MRHTWPMINKRRWILGISGIIAAGLLLACGGGSGASTSSGDGTGTVQFSVNWNRETTPFERRGPEDCVDITTVTADVYNSSTGQLLRSGGPWVCSDHQGTIEQVPAGGSGFAVIYGRDGTGGARYRGHSENVEIVAGRATSVGVIEAFYFVPNLVAPLDWATIRETSVDLNWEPVLNAAGYALVVSTTADLSNPVVDITVSGNGNTTYTISNLVAGNTYFWQVRAIDPQGAESGYDAIWRFNCPTQDNTPPSAQITSPVDGAIFTEGDTVIFNGSGTDAEDGVLAGSALTWASDIDGALGSGNVVQSDQLSLGPHIITLTAADSQGAAGATFIEITIAASSSQGIAGIWIFTADQPWAEGDSGCQPGASATGICRISETGNQFTLEFLTAGSAAPPLPAATAARLTGTAMWGPIPGLWTMKTVSSPTLSISA